MIRQDTLGSADTAVLRPRWLRTYRVLFAVLTLAAIAFQFISGSQRPVFSPFNFFCFFTIQANLLTVAVLLWGASGDTSTPSPPRDLVRGATVLFMTITFVVYGLLLAGYEAELQVTLPWVNNVLHRLMPIVMIVDWLIDPPHTRISFRQALAWLLYPVLYAVCSLLRGALDGWYPYPFLNPARVGGYAGVALYAVVIAVAAALLAWLVALVGRHVRLVVDTGRP